MPAASPRTGRAPTTLEVLVSARARSPLAVAEAERLARAVLRAEGVRHAVLSIAIVGRGRIRTLNRRHLGKDRETDVIAFALTARTDAPTHRGTNARGHGGTGARRHGPVVVGDVYVCAPVAAGQASALGVQPVDELRRLVVHGVLHVLGYDHPDRQRTASAMWRRQERLLVRFGRRR